MIIFIEGPDHASKDELYSQVQKEIRMYNNKMRVCFYDTRHNSSEISDAALFDARAGIRMAMQLSYDHPDMTFIIKNGPMSLISDALRVYGTTLAREMSAAISTMQYQRVNIISVSSPDDDEEERNTYRKISSMHMGIFSDSGKGNSYRLFMHKKTEAAAALFNMDVFALINN